MKTINFPVLIKTVIAGLLCTESYYLSDIIAHKIAKFIQDNSYEYQANIVFPIVSFIILFYLIYRGFFKKMWLLIRSLRFDLAIVFAAGIGVSVSFCGLGSGYYSGFIDNLSIWQILGLIGLPIFLALSFLLRQIQIFISKRHQNIPFFISDSEQKFKQDDLLGFANQSEVFAERVVNQESTESLVFGIDAPWGIGKSTFVNFCKEHWQAKYSNQVIAYTFNPLRYENRSNLLEKFIDGLIQAIHKNSFIPEIVPLISKYARFIKNAKSLFSLKGFNIGILFDDYSIDDILEDLRSALTCVNKKIIIIVDDLDRMNFSEIKDVLFTIKKSFSLPNVSYLLCYDSDNIHILEKEAPDTEKVTEFLEKFVNVKISIYLDAQALANFVSKNLTKVLDGNSQSDPILITQAIGGLLDIYKSKDYHCYLPFVGDIRKLKRLINTIILLEVEKTDFANSDFEKHDLIHLLLIYINYPNIFRKIYNTETNGQRGFFSVVIPYEDEYPKDHNQRGTSVSEHTYKNSLKYTQYLEDLSENQKFLLNKVFDITHRFENPNNESISQLTRIDSISQDIKKSFACFNGDGGWTGGRNLEEYLNLIVKLAKPQKKGQYKFYLNCRDRIRNGETVESVLAEDIFLPTESESSHEHFWRIITNSESDFDSSSATKLITYLLNNLHKYSLFTNAASGIGLRDDLSLFLAIIIDRIGWHDEDDKHHGNTVENVAEIAEWIFGEERHSENGVLKTLGKEDRGVLGLYDLLRFRLFCSADRGGNMFNLQRALSKHGDPQAPTEGSIRDIVIEEMREISQKTFQIFEAAYINKNRNFFDAVDALSLTDFAGQYNGFVVSKIAAGEITDSDKVIAEYKSLIKIFSIYQLGNIQIGSGIGCGYYDPTGKEDKSGINNRMNNYLFDVCFNPLSNINNYEHFLDYLLINFVSAHSFDEKNKYIPSVSEFTKVIKRDRLIDYWNKNGTAIKALNLADKEKKVMTVNYTASYKTHLGGLYEALDELITPHLDTTIT